MVKANHKRIQGGLMDDQNQPNNQFGNQPKKEEQADATSSAPVEAEPSTSGPVPPAVPTAPTTPGQNPVQTPSQSSMPPAPQAPATPSTAPQPEEEKKLEMPPQPGLLEAPKKKNRMLMALIVVALIVVLAVLGFVVYKAMY